MAYYTDTDINIQLTLNEDITGYTEAKINYIDPSGAAGAWAAETVTVAMGKLEYLLTAASNKIAGIWKLQVRVVLASGRVRRGLVTLCDIEKAL